jgi:hypothetical protein
LRAEGFSFSLDVLYGGLGIKVNSNSFDQKRSIFSSAVPYRTFFKFLVIKTPDPNPDPDKDSLEMLGQVFKLRIFFRFSFLSWLSTRVRALASVRTISLLNCYPQEKVAFLISFSVIPILLSARQ